MRGIGRNQINITAAECECAARRRTPKRTARFGCFFVLCSQGEQNDGDGGRMRASVVFCFGARRGDDDSVGVPRLGMSVSFAMSVAGQATFRHAGIGAEIFVTEAKPHFASHRSAIEIFPVRRNDKMTDKRSDYV